MSPFKNFGSLFKNSGFKSSGFRAVLMGSAAIAVAVMAQPAAAQSQGAGAESTEESQVVVVKGMRKSMRDALATKRAESGIVEVISSKDIGVLPDVTIAETLARLPGLNTTRDRGNDSQAAIRGLGPRMVLGLVNGREVASSEPDRNVRWEIFPSETVSGVEVYKTSQAKLVSGGISGTVDIQTLRPLDYSGPALTLRGGLVSYDGGTSLPNYDGLGWRASGAYVTKLTPQLGLVVSFAAQDQKNGYENIMGGGWNNAAPGAVTPGGPLVQNPWGASFEEKAIDSTRYSVSSSLQWKPTDSFEGRFDVLANSVKIDEEGNGGWFSDWGNWAGDGTGGMFTNTVIENGSLVAATVNVPWNASHPYSSHYQQDMKLFATGVNGKWKFEDWTVVADLAYSQAERYGLWQAVEMSAASGKNRFDYRGDHPMVYTEISPYEAAQNGTLYAANGHADVSHLRDTLTTANLDATRHFADGFWTSLQFGARLSSRSKEDAEPGSALTSAVTPLSGAALSANLFEPWTYKNFSVPTMVYAPYDKLAAIVYGTAGAARLNPDYKNTPFVSEVTEDVAEAYVQGNYETTFMGLATDGNVGVRVLSVKSESTGPLTGYGSGLTTASNDYTEVLPSANARMEIGDGAYIKVGLAQALSRPPLNDMRVDGYVDLSGAGPQYYGGAGNPYLKPYKSTQLDVAYENYFHKDGLFAVAAYYKNIENYIGAGTYDLMVSGKPVKFTSMVNADKSGVLEGVEITYQTPFYFIPGMDKFGIYSNAAFVGSDIKESTPAGNPYDMNGVAKTTATVDLWYADDKLEARLGMKYHTPFTILYTWSSGALSRVRSETTLDFSASYRVNDHVTARLQAGNLLDTPLRTYENNNPSQILRTDFYGRRILVDLTLKY